MGQEYKVVSLKDRRGEEPRHELRRVEPDWREGKPAEDPAKVKRWGLVSARPSEFLICMRGGEVVKSGQGASVFKWPWESVSIVPTTVQRLHFTADQVTREKVGVQVTGLAVYRIAAPLIAFRMLNFSYTERAQEKLQQLLVEMFVGAARRLVSNLDRRGLPREAQGGHRRRAHPRDRTGGLWQWPSRRPDPPRLGRRHRRHRDPGGAHPLAVGLPQPAGGRTASSRSCGPVRPSCRPSARCCRSR